MLSTRGEALAEQPAAAPPAAPDRPVAHLNARISAYLVDSVILLAVILIFVVIGGALLLFTSDLGEGEPPDWAYYAGVAVFLGGTILFWSALNIALMALRGQSAGMYVLGIKTAAPEGPPTLGRATVRWFGLNPLLYHPLLLPVWAILSLFIVSFALNQIVLAATLVFVLLCIAAPVAGLMAMVFDPERRAIHDRLANTTVVHFDQP